MVHLLRLRGFTVFMSMAFLNAFVDLGHKIVVQNTVFKVFEGPVQVVLTAVLNALILLLYLTAFPDDDGRVQFRRDIYARDAALLAALDGPIAWTPPSDFDAQGPGLR